MPIGINDLDDDDLTFGGLQQNTPPAKEGEDDDFIADFLKTRGIDDSSKIKFEDENNEIVERDWKDLSKEEKFNILNTPLEYPEVDNNSNINNTNEDLSEEELSFFNFLRENKLTPSQYMESLTQNIPETPLYQVDTLSDDELYLLDLESKVGELPDEQSAEMLNAAKQNEELYQKLVDGIRNEYKQKEELEKNQKQAEEELKLTEQYNQFANTVIESVDSFNSVGDLSLDLTNEDKDDIARFILERKEDTGYTWLQEALQDPNALVKVAWFLVNGEEVLKQVLDYYMNEIKNLTNLRSGSKKELPTTVEIDKTKKPQYRQYSSISELDDDE